MPSYDLRINTATTSTGPIQNEYKAPGGGKLYGTATAGMVKVETAEKKYPKSVTQ
jgi:hypothetical protein